MDPKIFDINNADVAWCPGCGNFTILKTIKETLVELEISQKNWFLYQVLARQVNYLTILKQIFLMGFMADPYLYLQQ